ncbi:MAG: 5'/3'-nucleotidase SurE [Armatimonadetes bacterium]|nr:5'/3'-nucleotidase SurE [Armatimonadota bacterium]NIM24237.1 5'/3'-nucleotidase SurE [Armatimonadota bacterium]NIM68106.1 5'/3'-nucleotidase SurE [Armatimonadota bacterium]NIM76568.1 5'/3'-nucleotidase SurE [Armatimonadota bacterium]NIN06311.1 5'/3'-nucleotidase SurE [Armatimonadota bacterium]
MKFLLTNDDGIHTPGLLALKQELSKLGKVYPVAPDRPRSATGHSITLHKPLRAIPVTLADGSSAWASNGTPSDCVVLGLSDLIGCKPDMVVSGINPGPNLGEDLTYSGTVSAAMEGTILGVPSFAISVAGQEVTDFAPAARFAVRLAKAVAAHHLPPYTFLNVNVPAVAEEEIRGSVITRQARRKYKGRLEKRIDPRGMEYYWLGGELLNEGSLTGTDVEAIQQNCISITPVHLDLTQHEFLEEMKAWDI